MKNYMMNIKRKLIIIIYVMILVSFTGCDYFFDYERPEIKILSPISGQTIYGSAEIIVEAKDNSKLHHIDLYLDGNMVKSFREGFFAYTWDLTMTNEDTEHTAKVIAYDARNNWNEAEVKFFGYGKSPICPNLISPVDGGVISFLKATLDWSDVSNAHYHLQVDDNADFSSPFISDISLTESKYAIMVSLDYKTYYWRVCAKHSWGDWSAWSQSYSFTCSVYKWKYQTGDAVCSSPAIGFDSTIYVSSRDYYLYALNFDGTLKWKSRIEKWASSPVIASDGTIYIGSENGYLYALYSDGSMKWSFKTNNKIVSAPAIGSDGSIYVGSKDYYVYALNADGSLKWKYGTGGSIDYSPAISSEGTIYISSDSGYLFAFNIDGTLKWRYRPSDDYIDSPPVIGSDGTIYLSWHRNQLHALNPDGSIKWCQQISDYPKISIGQDDILYIASTLVFQAYYSTGVRKWSYSFDGSCDGSLPTIGSDGTIYFAASYVFSGNSYLYAMNPNGSLKQTYNLGSFRIWYSSPAIGFDGTVYVGSCDGCLYAFPSNSSGLADSPWPKFGHDNQNTGRTGEP